jgi:hypothetical protein
MSMASLRSTAALVVLAGEMKPRYEADLGFRIGMIGSNLP